MSQDDWQDQAGFGEFRIPSGRIWDGTATPLAPGGDSTNDQGCLAIAKHPDGRVMLADTKLPLDQQQPIILLSGEWADHVEGITSGRI
ncbi:hypothetical protein OOJ91_33950 [Micromonospora lupini]|uniref:hypothetical protein n=1 Tax=Micromonospora lupini TaxID=285679 RepID=UPI0022563A7D|nr:hypothetical protein [Micromonospora lupini]MCX5070852.1 hypothetical protein [Micromonospora lupini]